MRFWSGVSKVSFYHADGLDRLICCEVGVYQKGKFMRVY